MAGQGRAIQHNHQRLPSARARWIGQQVVNRMLGGRIPLQLSSCHRVERCLCKVFRSVDRAFSGSSSAASLVSRSKFFCRKEGQRW